MTHYNYKSDFSFALDVVPEELGGYDFTLVLHTSGARTFVARRRGDVCQNCMVDGEGVLHIVCDRHGLLPGRLVGEMMIRVPDATMADGYRDTAVAIDTGIELTREEHQPVEAVATVYAPVAVLTAYDLAKKQGYTGTAEEYMGMLRDLPDIVGVAAGELRNTIEGLQTDVESNGASISSLGGRVNALESILDGKCAYGGIATEEHPVPFAGEFLIALPGWAYSRGIFVNGAFGVGIEIPNNKIGVLTKIGQFPTLDLIDTVDPALLAVIAKTDVDNNFSTGQTINGQLTVNGNIVQNGSAYETHAEKVYTKQDMIILREGAMAGIPLGSVFGLQAENYNGRGDACNIGCNGTDAVVGKPGEEQPLLTRKARSEMRHGKPLVFNSEANRAESGEWPELPAFVYKEAVVTYEDDDSTETFYVPTLPTNPNAPQP